MSEAFIDELACEKIVRQFALFADDGRFDELVDLFTEDGSFVRPLDPDNPLVGRDAIRQFFENRPPRITCHTISNTVIDLISEDRAEGSSHITFVSSVDVDSKPPRKCEPQIFYGRYQDEFRKTAQGWKIKSRHGSTTMVLSAQPDG